MEKVIQHKVLLLGALLLLIGGCTGKSDEDQNPLSEEEQESVQVRQEVVFAVADGQPIYQYVESDGVVEANNRVMLKPRISGYVEQVNLEEGQWVQKGDTLLEFDEQDWQYTLDQARNEYEQARNLYLNEKMLRRSLQGTNGNDTTDQSDRGIQLRVGLAQAEVELKRAKLELSYTSLIAPFSGTLAISSEQRISEGAYVSAGTELGQLVNDASVQVRFDVLESELSKVGEGMRVEVTSPGGETLNGTVSAVQPVVDTESKTGEIIARVDNRQQLLRPGMTVEGRILVQKETGKARIPRSAVLSRDGGRTLLFKLNTENNEVEWVYVTPVAQNNEWALIDHEDIAPGDTIAVGNHFSLSHLQIVSPKMQSLQREEAPPELQTQEE